MYSPSVKVKFSSEVFYNELLLTLSEHTYETVPRRVYFYDDATITEKTAMKEVLTTIFYVMKWIFLVFTIIGLGHYLF